MVITSEAGSSVASCGARLLGSGTELYGPASLLFLVGESLWGKRARIERSGPVSHVRVPCLTEWLSPVGRPSSRVPAPCQVALASWVPVGPGARALPSGSTNASVAAKIVSFAATHACVEPLPGPQARRMRAVARAASVASKPLSSVEPGRPARARACASSSQVSSPNPTGVPVSSATRFRPSVAAAHT